MKSVQLIIFLLFTSVGVSQSYYQQIHSFDEGVDESGLSVLEVDSNLYVISSGISTELPRKYFTKFSSDGSILLNKTFSDFGGRDNCFLSQNQDFFYTGTDLNFDFQTTLLLNKSGDILERYICVSDSLLSANISSSVIFGDYLITSKNSFVSDGSGVDTELCWLNLNSGAVDTMIRENSGFNDRVGDMVVGIDSLLTIVYIYQDQEYKSEYYRSIHKFNKSKEKVWEWTSEILYDGTRFHGFTLAILEDGRMVHTNGRFTYEDLESPSIRAINPDGSLSWHYDFPVWLLPMPPEDFFKYRLFHLIRTENNDLVGCGWYDDVPNLKGYLFRMNSEGKMLWERYYYTDSINYYNQFGYEYISGGQFFDIEELANGDLAVVGEKHIHKQGDDGSWTREEDLWLLRLNADGCIGDYCGEDRKTTITSTNEEELKEDTFTIYPNPASHEIMITLVDNSEVNIYSVNGNEIKSFYVSKGDNVLDISNLDTGIYFLKFYSKSQNAMIGKKFIKI